MAQRPSLFYSFTLIQVILSESPIKHQVHQILSNFVFPCIMVTLPALTFLHQDIFVRMVNDE